MKLIETYVFVRGAPAVAALTDACAQKLAAGGPPTPGYDKNNPERVLTADKVQARIWMKTKFAAFVAVATIAGSLAVTPASAQRGAATGVAAPDRYYEPGPYGSGRGPYDYFGSCEWVQQRFYDGQTWRVRRARVCG